MDPPCAAVGSGAALTYPLTASDLGVIPLLAIQSVASMRTLGVVVLAVLLLGLSIRAMRKRLA